MFSTVERRKIVARRFGKGQLRVPPIANNIESTLNDAAGQGCDWYCEQGECISENGLFKNEYLLDTSIVKFAKIVQLRYQFVFKTNFRQRRARQRSY